MELGVLLATAELESVERVASVDAARDSFELGVVTPGVPSVSVDDAVLLRVGSVDP